MRFEPSGPTNDADIRIAKSIVDYVFRWMGKKFLDVDQQEEIGILSPEVRARKLAEEAAQSVSSFDTAGPEASTGAESVPAATALTDSPPVVPARMQGLDLGPACSQCGGTMQRTGSCYTCSSCGNNTGCG